MSKRLIQKKICLLGDFAVGKTSLVKRFVENKFDDTYMSTIGVKISRKPLSFTDHNINLLIWDLAGGIDLTRAGHMYLKGAAGCLIVVDLTRRETLEKYTSYAKQFQLINPDASILLVGNKTDLTTQRVISDQELEQLNTNGLNRFVTTSAKTGSQVENAFTLLAQSFKI